MAAPLRTFLAACLTGAVCLLPAEATAQRRANSGAAAPRDTGAAARPHTVAAVAPDTLIRYSVGRMASAGFVGGMLGAVAGGVAFGPLLGGDDCRDICSLGSMVAGAIIGESIGLATGVHMGNGSQGSWGATTVGSAGVVGLGLLVAAVTDTPQVLFVVPLAQLMAATRIQRFTMPDGGG